MTGPDWPSRRSFTPEDGHARSLIGPPRLQRTRLEREFVLVLQSDLVGQINCSGHEAVRGDQRSAVQE